MKMTVRRLETFFAILGIADIIVALIRYPPTLPALNQFLDVLQGALGVVSVMGIIFSPILFEDVPKGNGSA